MILTQQGGDALSNKLEALERRSMPLKPLVDPISNYSSNVKVHFYHIDKTQ